MATSQWKALRGGLTMKKCASLSCLKVSLFGSTKNLLLWQKMTLCLHQEEGTFAEDIIPCLKTLRYSTLLSQSLFNHLLRSASRNTWSYCWVLKFQSSIIRLWLRKTDARSKFCSQARPLGRYVSLHT
jgi:hypothetical protein